MTNELHDLLTKLSAVRETQWEALRELKPVAEKFTELHQRAQKAGRDAEALMSRVFMALEGIARPDGDPPPSIEAYDLIAKGARELALNSPHMLVDDEIRLANSGQTIAAIKAVRERTSLGLKEAKDLVEAYTAMGRK